MPIFRTEDLPTRVLLGRTLRVEYPNCLAVLLAMDFGLTLERLILIEGIERDAVPPHLRLQAKKAMIVLVGGKSLVVHTDDVTTIDGHIHGRVFLNEKVYAPPPDTMMTPFGCPGPLLEVSTIFKWMAANKFDIGKLKDVLNGSRRHGSA